MSRLLLLVLFLVAVIYALWGPPWSRRETDEPIKVTFADCIWSGEVRTWHDQDGNGRMDPDEPPLGSVSIQVFDAAAESDKPLAATMTDGQGTGRLRVTLPGCPQVRLELQAETPPGFSPLGRRAVGKGKLFLFGFESANSPR